MNQTAGTRIFGMRVTLDPKIIIGVLLALAALLYWFNSDSEDSSSGSSARTNSAGALPAGAAPSVPVVTSRPAIAQRRTGAPANERGTLRLRAVDATRGDVDPTLRLDLLKRLASIQPAGVTRSLFEVGSSLPSAATNLPVIKAPIIHPVTPPTQTAFPAISGPAPLNIPLKYYGFVKPTGLHSTNSGLFLDGDLVMVASEGEVLKQRYMVVELTPNSARLEDITLKQGQTLPVVPMAVVP